MTAAGEWNTFVEEAIDTSSEAAVGVPNATQRASSIGRPQPIHEVQSSSYERFTDSLLGV